MRASIQDVAARAGVSPATVSRSLRGRDQVAPDTRRRVEEAARDLSYVASPLAAGLASGRTSAVAVVVPFVTRWFFSTLVAGATDVLREGGYDVLLYHLGTVEARDRFFGRMPLARKVDGVLTCSMPLDEEQTLALRALDLPYVGIGPHLPGRPSVGIDEHEAAAAAVRHLVQQGHERIGFLGGVPDDPGFMFASSPLRRRGYEEALLEAGLEVDRRLCASGTYGVSGGASAMADLLTGPVRPTAVVAEYDELAFGALATLRRAGMAVPGDVSVIGIDDHEMSDVMELTTLSQQVGEQGAVAARMLLGQMRGDAAEDDVRLPVRLPVRLVVRGSTAPPDSRRSR